MEGLALRDRACERGQERQRGQEENGLMKLFSGSVDTSALLWIDFYMLLLENKSKRKI